MQLDDSRFISILQRITGTAQQGCEKPAIVSASRQITYGQLLACSYELAQQFAEIVGENPGVVAISSSDPGVVIASALAAWRLSCPYLPIDPSGPTARNLHMLGETKAKVLVTDEAVGSHWGAHVCPVLPLEENFLRTRVDSSPFPAQSGDWDVNADDGAYVMYTSGSSGRPKGVAITQANLSHLVKWHHHAFQVAASDRGTQFSALTFDASVLEIWPLLAAGATLYVPDRETVLSSEALRDFLVAKEITISFAPTIIAERLLSLAWPGETRLRFLLTGADTLRTFPKPELPFLLVNNYGPTECTVLATSGIVPTRAVTGDKPLLGTPIPGAQVWILDDGLRPVPDGTKGQIAIAGDGVARGYIAGPELTNRSFVSAAWPGAPRLYLTGDLGVRLSSGELEFCGRLDDQVKLRGFRVEPGEIIQALRTHDSISAATVITVGEQTHMQLAAYFVSRKDVNACDLRAHLEKQLPSYMIPDYFVRVPELPLTSHGKLNRAALPAPHSGSCGAETENVQELRTEIQESIGSILSDVLASGRLELHDNFFRLGGHSLLAAQVVVRIRKQLDVDLPIRTVFQFPTVAGLSSEVERRILSVISAAPHESTEQGSALTQQ